MVLLIICFTDFSLSEIAHAIGIDNNKIDSNVDVDGPLGLSGCTFFSYKQVPNQV